MPRTQRRAAKWHSVIRSKGCRPQMAMVTWETPTEQVNTAASYPAQTTNEAPVIPGVSSIAAEVVWLMKAEGLVLNLGPSSTSSSHETEEVGMQHMPPRPVPTRSHKYGESTSHRTRRVPAHLRQTILHHFDGALSASSKQLYRRAFSLLEQFIQTTLHTDCMLPISVKTVALFVYQLS